MISKVVATGSARMVFAPGRLGVGLMVATLAQIVSPRSSHAGQPALAETLYQQGRDLMARGRIADACPKFEESQSLDPATGTLLNLAVCHEAEGKIASAWAEFRAAAAMAAHDLREDRSRLARERLAIIEPQLSRLTIVVRDAARLAGIEVRLDGTVLGPPAWNVATPIDPGIHTVDARVPGQVPLKRVVWVDRSPSDLSVVVEWSAPAPTPIGEPGFRPATNRPDESAAATGPAANKAPTNQASVPPLRIASYLSVATGTAALVIGGVFGARAFSKWSDRNRECPRDLCTERGVADATDAQNSARTADVAVGLGLVGLIAGAYLHHRARLVDTEVIPMASARPVRILPRLPSGMSLSREAATGSSLDLWWDW